MEDLMGGHQHQTNKNAKQTSAHKIKVEKSINLSNDNITGYEATRDEDSIDEMGNALKNQTNVQDGENGGSQSKSEQFSSEMTILQCFWVVTKMATPTIIGMFLYLLVQLVNTYYVGNKNEPALLAGVGMGNMLINVLCFAII